MRWENPDTGEVVEGRLEVDSALIAPRWSDTEEDFRLAVVVATFAEVLRESPFAADIELGQLVVEAEALGGRDGDITELAELIRLAQDLS